MLLLILKHVASAYYSLWRIRRHAPIFRGVASSNRDLDAAFGTSLRTARTKAGLSQEELAHRCDLHRTYVSFLERGLRSPSLAVISRLAEELGTEAWKLVRAAELQ